MIRPNDYSVQNKQIIAASSMIKLPLIETINNILSGIPKGIKDP